MEKEKKVKKTNKVTKEKKKTTAKLKESPKVAKKVVDKKKEIKKEPKKIAKESNKKLILKLIPLLLVLVLVVWVYVYLNDYYKADIKSINAFMDINNVSKKMLEDNTIIYENDNNSVGLIFYPGAKVEYTSYKPLMKELASKGVTTVLLEMPFNLAIFDKDAANRVKEQLPNIKTWYIAGHSLGGTIAAKHVCSNVEEYEGLILIAAYSTCDLSKEDIKTMTIYGTKDKVLSMEKYEEKKSLLPSTFNEVVIEGGNHAQFGMYGIQRGDGEATINNVEQINMTANEIFYFIID